MRHLAVSIAASIDKPWQWKLFFDEGGGVLPLLECIKDGGEFLYISLSICVMYFDVHHIFFCQNLSCITPCHWIIFVRRWNILQFAARSVEQGGADFLDGDIEGTTSLMEQHEASFAAACTACRALRDLSALSKDFSAVVTDDILKVNAQWSTCVIQKGKGKGYDCSSGGLISDLLILLKHANEAKAFYKAPKKGSKRGSRRANFSLSSRRRRRGKFDYDTRG